MRSLRAFAGLGGKPFITRSGAISLLLALSGQARAATASFSTNPPVLGSVIISNLTGAFLTGHGPNDAPDSNVNDPRYVADDQPVQGQTFTTGSNTNGYKLTAVTLRHVSYSTFVLVPSINYTIRITRPLTTNSLSVNASENAEVMDDYLYLNCDTCNFDTIGGGSARGNGTGRFITFLLDTPVHLAPNTLYGFDVGGGHVRHYWETDGRDSTPGGGGGTPLDPYSGGNAYSSGLFNGVGDNTMTNRAGDRVFVVAMVPGNVVIPPRITRQPRSAVYYAGRTALFTAKAAGGTNLVYQWKKDGANLSNGTKFSGVLTDTLSISNVTAAETGTYTLSVTNSGGSTNSAPATLAVITAPQPSANYAYFVFTNNALAYWRLNESVDPSTNPPAYDYIGGGIGTYGTDTIKTNGPRPSAYPGFESTNSAVQATAFDANSVMSMPALSLDTNTVTFTAWIYPVGAQQEFAGLIWSHAGSTAAGLSFGNHYTTPTSVGQLNYMWNLGTAWTFVSGLTIPSDQWSFVALVISPTSGTLYLGSGGPLSSAVNSIAHVNELWNGPSLLGIDPLYSPERVFNGMIDEVAVFKRSLSLDQINTLYNIGRGIVQPVPPAFTGDPPMSQALYAGRIARFKATATGSSPLVYRWQKNGGNLNDGGNISGAQIDSLTISNVALGDAGAYTLKVTNSVGAITSSPPATLAIVAPAGKSYETAVRSANPVAYWRLNEKGDPSTNTPAFDYWGSFAGIYGVNAFNGFSGVQGPQPPDFSEFETNNAAWEGPFLTANSWVTVPPLNLNTNTVTITLWLKPNVDPVNDYAGLFFSREASASVNGVGLRYGTNSQLGYTWNLGSTETSQFFSGLTPPANQWSFAALVIEPTKATIYLYNTNALASATNPIPHVAEAWDGHAFIGYNGGYYDHNFPGDIDEVAVFNYAFTPTQVLNLYNAAFGDVVPPVTLTITKIDNQVVLSWPQGTLLEAPELIGPWTTNSANSPFTNSPASSRKFYRVLVR
jgi:Immunoglobulin I-set domain.